MRNVTYENRNYSLSKWGQWLFKLSKVAKSFIQNNNKVLFYLFYILMYMYMMINDAVFWYKEILEVSVYCKEITDSETGTIEVAIVSLWRCKLQCTGMYFQTEFAVQIVTVTSCTIPPIILKHISKLYAIFMPLISFSVVMNQQRWRPESCNKAPIFSRCHISHISTINDQTPQPTDFRIGFASQ